MALSSYRPVGVYGARYPKWVQALRGRSGVYVIREGRTVRYVGESHTGRLYETLTRHFQAWSGETSGPSYDRSSIDVAIETIDESVDQARDAPHRQTALICSLNPEDNRRGCEVVPF